MTVKTGIVSKTGTVSKCINLSDLMTVVSRSVTARILVSLQPMMPPRRNHRENSFVFAIVPWEHDDDELDD